MGDFLYFVIFNLGLVYSFSYSWPWIFTYFSHLHYANVIKKLKYHNM